MPDYTTLSTQIEQYKTAASALMNSGSLDANELSLVGASLNAMANSLGVADVNNALTSAISTIDSTKTSAIAAFNAGTNGSRLTLAETKITDLQARTTNIEGFVTTNSTQYSTLQSTVNGLQTSLGQLPSNWTILTTNTTVLNNARSFITTQGITVTLPLNPSLGFSVQLIDATGGSVSTATPAFTIARNGQRIQGLLEDLVMNVANAGVQLVWVNATRGWVLT